MKVRIVSENLFSEKKGGIPRFVDNIYSRVRKNMDVDIFVPRGRKLPLFNTTLNSFWFKPREIGKSIDDGIVHLERPELDMALLFLKTARTVVTVHDLSIFLDPAYSKLIGNAYKMQYRLLSKADKVVCVSTQTQQETVEFLKTDIDIRTIVHGVDKKFRPASRKEKNKLRLTRDETLDLSIGCLRGPSNLKRVPKLIRDFADNYDALGNAKLSVWGRRMSVPEVERTAQGVSGVMIKDPIPEDDIVNTFNSLDALFVPSSYEGFGLPIAECTACEVPVFTYRDAKIPDEVKNLSFEVDSVKEVPQVLVDMHKSEMRKRATLVRKYFDWERAAKEYLKVYEELE